MRTLVHKGLVLPIALGLRGELGAYRLRRSYAELEFDIDALSRLRHRRLNETLAHAKREAPFYARALEGRTPELSAFPILTKSDVVDRADQLRAARGTPKTTGGSTGQAVTVWKDPLAIASERAITWLAFGWYGIGAGDRCIRFWGSGGTADRVRRARLADVAMNRVTASAFAFDEDDMARYWSLMRRYAPRYVYGYVSMLEAISRWAQEADAPALTRPPEVVITTSESLLPPQRAVIGAAFGAPVRNEYGCGEVGPIAYECPEGVLHTADPNLWLEVCDERGDPVPEGSLGQLLVTDLTNRAMPLIRYRVGDSVRTGGECRCGRAFGTLLEIAGRAYDFIEDAEGKRYHGEAVMYLFEDLRTRGYRIPKFQVTQRESGVVEVRVVAVADGAEVKQELEALFHQRLGGMLATVSVVDDIPPLDSGKAALIRRLQPE